MGACGTRKMENGVVTVAGGMWVKEMKKYSIMGTLINWVN